MQTQNVERKISKNQATKFSKQALRCDNTHTHIHTQPASYIELDIDLTLSLCVWEYPQSYTGSLFRFISQKVFSIQLFEERFN